jgi:hypothetical protein
MPDSSGLVHLCRRRRDDDHLAGGDQLIVGPSGVEILLASELLAGGHRMERRGLLLRRRRCLRSGWRVVVNGLDDQLVVRHLDAPFSAFTATSNDFE